MGPFIIAWLIGEGIIVFRSVKQRHIPPGPGELMWSSGLFVGLALLAEVQDARRLATLLAFGFDIAAFMNLFPPVTGSKDKTNVPSGHAANWPPEKIPPTQLLPGHPVETILR